MSGITIRNGLAALLCMVSAGLWAQPSLEPGLSLAELVKSERFRSNARLMVNGKSTATAGWATLNLTGTADVQVTFRKDSVRLVTSDSAGNRLEVSFPNDITLLTNADRKELQERLLLLLKSHTGSWLPQPVGSRPAWVNTVRGATRFGLLADISFTDSIGAAPVCHPSLPLYSLVNSMRDTLSCDGLFPVRLVLHRYGNATDTLDTTVAGILRATGSAGWMKWSGVEANELTLLLQHPFIGYEHLLFIRMDPRKNNRWLADLHAFIPTHNLVGLFTAYTPAKRKELFKVIR